MTPDHGATPPHRDSGGDGANQALAAALDAHARGAGGPADVHSALAASRLLIPVREHEPGGGSHLASVTVSTDDGGEAMLAFTTDAALRRWDGRARSVPMPTRSAAEAALANGADSLVIDIAGPVTFAVDAPGMRSLASGWRDHGVWPAVGQGPEPELGTTSQAEFGDEESPPDGARPAQRESQSARELILRPVIQRALPAATGVATRVWSALHQRVSRIGIR